MPIPDGYNYFLDIKILITPGVGYGVGYGTTILLGEGYELGYCSNLYQSGWVLISVPIPDLDTWGTHRYPPNTGSTSVAAYHPIKEGPIWPMCGLGQSKGPLQYTRGVPYCKFTKNAFHYSTWVHRTSQIRDFFCHGRIPFNNFFENWEKTSGTS